MLLSFNIIIEIELILLFLAINSLTISYNYIFYILDLYTSNQL